MKSLRANFRRMKSLKSDLIAGFGTALFSIPEGMAYAKLAGVNPVYGLYSGIAATITSSLTARTVLMISTLTSAIAISTHSVMETAGITSHEMHSALFTLTFLIGLIMLILGLLKLGGIVSFVSNAVMTGFIVGASFLILVGELGDLVGYGVTGGNKFEHLVNWLLGFSEWDPVTTAVGVGSIILMIILKRIPKLEKASAVFVLLIGTLCVHFLQLKGIKFVGDIAKVTGGLPSFSLPDPAMMPRLALGSLSVALVALIQGAGVSSAIPNPDKSKTNFSRDFVSQGLGNLFGSLFQSMGTGGSLSRTAVSLAVGAKSRLSGVFAGIWLLLLLVVAGQLITYIPLVVMSGILCVIAVELIVDRISDIRLIVRSSMESTLVMLLTFLSALFIPLQWTIFLGAALSLLFYLYTSTKKIHLHQIVKNDQGYFEEHKLPSHFPSNRVTVISFDGNLFFAEVPVMQKMIPSIEGTSGAAIIWRVRGMEDMHSTFLKWMEHFIKDLHDRGNIFFLEGVEPHVMKILEKTNLLELIGEDHVFSEEPGYWMALNKALEAANRSIKKKEFPDIFS